MLIYHGSGVEVREPKVLQVGYEKDFSWGFYCTKSVSQAERWARRHNRGAEKPTVNVYQADINPQLKMKVFPEMSDEWLDFIANCRNGKLHEYDIVEGPMADDEVWNYVEDFLNGNITRKAFWALAEFKHPTHQITFHTDAALQCLTFKEAYQL